MNPTLDIVLKALRYLCYLVFTLRFVYDVVRERKLPMMTVALIVLACAVIISTNNMKLGFIVLVLAAVRRVSLDKLVKATFYAVSVSYALLTLSALIGVLPNWVFYRYEIKRYALGFVYATDTFSVFFVIVLMYFYIYRYRARILTVIELFVLALILYRLTDGRLGFILTVTALAAILVTKVLHKFPSLKKVLTNKKLIKIIKTVCMTLPALFLVFMIVISCLYGLGDPLAQKLNDMLSDRLKYNMNALENYAVTPFGTHVDWISWGGRGYTHEFDSDFVYNYVDSSYIRNIFDLGVIATVIVIIGYTFLVRDLFKSEKYLLAFIIVLVLVWSVVEPYMLHIGRNMFVVCLAPYFDLWMLDLKKRK